MRSGSLKRRFILTSVGLAGVMLAVAFYTESLVRREARLSAKIAQHYQALDKQVHAVEQYLQETESALYQYSILFGPHHRDAAESRLQLLAQEARALEELEALAEYPQFYHTVMGLRHTLAALSQEAIRLLDVLSNAETRYPGMPLLVDKLQPTNIRFTEAVNLAIYEVESQPDSPEQREIRAVLKDLRYAWAQNVSAVRVFVANRSGVFGDPIKSMGRNLRDRQLYADKVAELLERLTAMDSRDVLGFQQSLSLEEMRAARTDYERYFEQAVDIYYSPNWRADLPILRTSLRPLLDDAWHAIHALEEGLEDIVQGKLTRSLDTSGTLSTFIWLLTGAFYLLLIAAYLVYIHTVRRPLLEVAKALEAEGKGEPYVLQATRRSQEIELLEGAFEGMREQVRSRQSRLESILNNAKDGIITIDAHGTIETFNKAAEELFGFTTTEAIGENVTMLMPSPERERHDSYLERCRGHRGATVAPAEREVTAQRKDGSTFPMRLNLSELELNGQRLFTAIVADISEQKAMVNRLRELAEHDSLTGLYNRHYFMQELERVVARARRTGAFKDALLYIDLDNFKYVNDALGHMAGDHVLKSMSELLRQRARKTDLMARIGGDEFGIILYNVDRVQAVDAAESFREQLADFVFNYKGEHLDIGCSIGVVMLSPEMADKEDLLARADLACHLAKRAGRNRVHVYEREDQKDLASMCQDMGWARRIKGALERDGFLLARQPIVHVGTEQVVCHEILVRMRAENGDLIMPSGFLSSASRFGLMPDLDRWIIEKALRSLAVLREQEPNASFSLNLAAASVGDYETLDTIVRVIQGTGLDPSAVIFEVSENVAVSEFEKASAFLRELVGLGCRTALDDFGVGYSSFAYLKDLPVDFVKLDGSLVCNIDRQALDLAMIKSMAEVARAVGKKTIAEFVDNVTVLRILKEVGVDFAQGELFGMPEVMTLDTEESALPVSREGTG